MRYLGLSEPSAETIEPGPRGASDHRRAERVFACGRATRKTGVLETCRELGIGFVPYSPLGTGLPHRRLQAVRTDFAPDDYRRNSPRFQGDNFEKNLALVDQGAGIWPQRPRAARRRSSRWRGSWRRAPTSCRSRAPSAANISRRTSARSTSCSTAGELETDRRGVPARCGGGHALPGAHDAAAERLSTPSGLALAAGGRELTAAASPHLA